MTMLRIFTKIDSETDTYTCQILDSLFYSVKPLLSILSPSKFLSEWSDPTLDITRLDP